MTIGHNSKRVKKPRPADVSRASGYIDRVKRLIEQQKELGADISDVCTEAKQNAGLDPTVIRFTARELLMDATKRRERDEKRADYLHAVGLAVEAVRSGEMSAREAAKVYNIGKTSIYKELSVREVSADWVDFEYTPIREMTADDLGDPLLVIDKPRAQFREKVRTLVGGRPFKFTPAPAPQAAVTDDELEAEYHRLQQARRERGFV